MGKNKMKMVVAILCALALIFALTGCGSTEGAEESPSASGTPSDSGSEGMADEVTMILPADTATLAPFEGQNGGRTYCINTFYETLGVMDQRGEELSLVLLKSCEETSPCEYELVLWDNIFDTAGNHITASDVKYCFDTCQELTAYNGFLSALDHMEITGDYTLTMYLKEEQMGALILIMQNVPIISQAAYEADPDSFVTRPIGTTGYVCTDFVEGYGFTAEYVGTWHEDEQPTGVSFAHTVQKINYIYLNETSQMRLALQNGDADVCFSLATTDLDTFRNADGFSVNEDIDNRVTLLLFNCDEGKLTSDIHLRKAISYAIDRTSINEFVFDGLGALPNSCAGVKLIDYNSAWDTDGYYDFSVEDAKAELALSSYSNETITLLTTTNADLKSEAELIATYLKEVGINCAVKAMEDSLVESTASSSDEWDIWLSPRGAEDYMVNVWTRFVSADSYGGKTQNFVDDSRLQEYFNQMLAAETYSVELVNEASQYMEDMCYAYAIVQAPTFAVYNSSLIQSLALNYKAFPLANAFVYN